MALTGFTDTPVCRTKHMEDIYEAINFIRSNFSQISKAQIIVCISDDGKFWCFLWILLGSKRFYFMTFVLTTYFQMVQVEIYLHCWSR